MKQTIYEFIEHWFSKSQKETYNIKDARITNILDDYNDTKQTVVIVDDNSHITEIIADDFDNSIFNIIKITGKEAYDDIYTIMNSAITVDYLVTDLSLDTRYFDGKNLFKFDGIDVLIMFVKRFKYIKYVIYTGIPMNVINDLSYDLGKKYKEYFGNDIGEVTISKSEISINLSDYFTN